MNIKSEAQQLINKFQEEGFTFQELDQYCFAKRQRTYSDDEKVKLLRMFVLGPGIEFVPIDHENKFQRMVFKKDRRCKKY